ncbi:SusD/RagB family nutrient-binding outer membrane lipoprotein [Fibrella sp. HMF5335]|uniref:SusD/RagB family nutrient-binding outer membrane lipoprotein n=1 Tax=Fibrella rubiginis TaxID=2817060 RepID=A0A939K4Q8_9BACT|nr:SusD/RagB family nutrient-binding outer membrane lipoprotein [Fibrella rubiginis]MBO0936968.1 SusD/RagB family nutrient-binding outer membrane lipoprotein [Fibrella rubiginis]
MTAIQTKFFRFALLTLPLTVGLQSCSDTFFDVNTTPNNPTVVPATVLLTTVEYDIAFASSNDLNRIAEVFMQHAAGVANQVATYDVYNIRGASDNQWNGELYAGALINSQQIIDLTQAASPAYAGIAKLLKAHAFSIVTNMWGDVPYSQALQGTNTLSPRLDKQQDIYLGNSGQNIQGLFDLVKEGMADIDKGLDKAYTGFKPATDDVVYGGDLTKWKRLGNTMLMRLAIIIGRKEPATAKKIIDEAIASSAGLLNDNALDFQVGFGSDNGKQNPIYSFNFVNRPSDGMASTRFIDSLTAYKDPRLARFYTTVSGAYVGFNNGSVAAAPALAGRSRIGAYLTGAGGEAPIRIITNFQRAFMQAEAVLTLGVAGNAQTFYQEGIRASMVKAGIATADINTYFTANPQVVTLSGSPQNQLRQVMTQKWIANFGIGLEAFDDYRRTGYPALSQVLNPSGDDGTRPVRLPYTDNEIQRNPNVPNPGPKTNERLWWDID